MRIGAVQKLTIVRNSPHGYFLSDGETDVLLPRNEPTQGAIGDELEVFIYTDSEDRPVATLSRPWAMPGEFAILPVVAVNESGSFLAWGLDKDLFCPFREQRRPLRVGEDAFVRIYLDAVSGRIACSTKISKFLDRPPQDIRAGEKVRVSVSFATDEFIEAIVDSKYLARLFPDEWHELLRIGDERDAYIKQIRADGKIALSLRPQGYSAVEKATETILAALKANNGFLPVSDQSTPREIHRRFGLSKSMFKKALGALYRSGEVSIEEKSVRAAGKPY